MGASSFYGKSRLRQVERCVLRLMAAVRKKLQGHAEDPFKVNLLFGSEHDTGLKIGMHNTHVCMHAVLAMVLVLSGLGIFMKGSATLHHASSAASNCFLCRSSPSRSLH